MSLQKFLYSQQVYLLFAVLQYKKRAQRKINLKQKYKKLLTGMYIQKEVKLKFELKSNGA
jgi:hypothetical protein